MRTFPKSLGAVVAALALMLATTSTPAGASAQSPDPATRAGDTIYVIVRHAQKAGGDDPGLTTEGEAHAQALAAALADAGVSAIYATPYRRTQATAAPLAARMGIEVTRYAPGDAAATAASIRAAGHHGTVLIVGHSNTVPALVEAFAGVAVPAMPETDYSRLYAIAVGGDGRARLLRLSMP
jgi:phosphohistidine phosphatase SixA